MIMTERESLLDLISSLKAEAVTASIYGDHWRIHDFRLRRSYAAGDYCLTIADLEKAEAKANRRPKSIGARKARQKAKAARRKLRKLEQVIAESSLDYNPTEPQCLSAPVKIIMYETKPRIRIRHKKLECRMTYTAT